jgi:hypothetical protein
MGGMGMQMMGMGGMGMQMMGMGGMGMQMMGMGGMAMMGQMMGMAGMGGMMGMMGMGGMGGIPGAFVGGSFAGGFNGSLGLMGAIQAQGLIQLITKVVAPGEWFRTSQQQPLAPMLFPGLGMIGGGGPNMMGMIGAGPPPPQDDGPADIQQANTIEFFAPSLALIARAPSRIHTNITGGIIGGKNKKVEAAQLLERRGIEIAKVGGGAGRNNGGVKVAAPGGKEEVVAVKTPPPGKAPKKSKEELDPAKIWQEALTKEAVEPGLVIATADFLFEFREYKHAAEFLKANLRQGIVVRPWVYEALAIALELGDGDKEEIRRARLSAVALDPQDAQGFLKAARTMAENKQWERALAFCRQAAQIEPNLAQPYEEALTLAEVSKDSKAMEWAAGKLVSQDWPTDDLQLHEKAKLRLQGLARTLQSEKRGGEADRLQEALARLNRRDLIVKLSWDCSSEPAEVEMLIKEPCGSTCTSEQTQTPGGGTLLSTGVILTKEPSVTYKAAQAFSGEYEIKVRRVWGQPVGQRAKLTIIENQGTPQERKRLEFVNLTQASTIKFTLKDGRRTELANMPPPGSQPQRRESQAQAKGANAISQLRALAQADFSDARGPTGAAYMPGAAPPPAPPQPRQPQPDVTVYQSGVTPMNGAGMNLTAQLQMSEDRRELNLRLQPVYQTVNAGRPPVNLSVIPGGANP